MAPNTFLFGLIALAAQSVASPVAAAAAAAPTLYLAGDSTMTAKGYATTCFPLPFIVLTLIVYSNNDGTEGWGLPLANDVTLPVVNDAIAGRSARSFTREGRFTSMAANVKSGDYVIIEFGHNDGGSITPTDNGRTDW